MIKAIFCFLMCLNSMKCYNVLKPFVVGGSSAEITEFPYSATLLIPYTESENRIKSSYTCGCSILNQRILLTAAHCLICFNESAHIIVMFGNENKENMKKTVALRYLVHSEFSEREPDRYDIALVMTNKALEFSTNVARVAIVKNPPYDEMGYIAGWGFIDEIRQIHTTRLQYTNQKIMNQADCQKALGRSLPKGVICGGTKNDKSYPSKGDSGSALVVRGYIQVGIVSCKFPGITRSISIYTDVGYFYGWILEHTRYLYCDIQEINMYSSSNGK